jgi:hypothetical protein
MKHARMSNQKIVDLLVRTARAEEWAVANGATNDLPNKELEELKLAVIQRMRKARSRPTKR